MGRLQDFVQLTGCYYGLCLTLEDSSTKFSHEVLIFPLIISKQTIINVEVLCVEEIFLFNVKIRHSFKNFLHNLGHGAEPSNASSAFEMESCYVVLCNSYFYHVFGVLTLYVADQF